MLVELLIILQWFNPFAWLQRNLVIQNLEFQVDAALISQGEDKKTYQYHLLHTASPNYPLSITSNFNQSLLKNRIAMMNRKRSSLSVFFKYTLLLPICLLLLVAFKPSSPTIATPQHSTYSKDSIQLDRLYVFISDRATQKELRGLQKRLEKLGEKLDFANLRYDKNRIVEAAMVMYDKQVGFIVNDYKAKEVREERAFLFLGIERDLNNFGAKYDELTINRMLSNDQAVVLSASGETVEEISKDLLYALEKAEKDLREKRRIKAADPNDKGERSNYTKIYNEVNEETLAEIQERLEKEAGTVHYLVDGLEWETDEATDLLTKKSSRIESLVMTSVQYIKYDESGNALSSTPWEITMVIRKKMPQISE